MPATRLPAAIPPAAGQVLLGLLASPRAPRRRPRASPSASARAVAYEYLTALKDEGIAELTGAGRGSRFRLAGHASARAAAGSGT